MVLVVKTPNKTPNFPKEKIGKIMKSVRKSTRRSGSALRRLGILSAIVALGAGVALAPGSGAPDAELVIDFDPLFIDGDFYTNTPARSVTAVWQTNGQYMVNPPGWYVSTVETGGLYVAIERSIFRTDALLALEFYDGKGKLDVGLLDTDGVALNSNLFGNLMEGSWQKVRVNFEIPLEDYPEATRIRIQGSGAIVFEARLYPVGEDNGAEVKERAEKQVGGWDGTATKGGLTDRENDFVQKEALTDSDNDGLRNYKVKKSGANSPVGSQGKHGGGLTITVTYPEDGSYILW